MTAKQAIKARCRDSLAGARECTLTDCALKGLHKSKRGAARYKAIRAYCRWCLNKQPFNVCNSPDCGIYRYRKGLENTPNLLSNPMNSSIFRNPESKDVKTYGKVQQGLKNAFIELVARKKTKELGLCR